MRHSAHSPGTTPSVEAINTEATTFEAGSPDWSSTADIPFAGSKVRSDTGKSDTDKFDPESYLDNLKKPVSIKEFLEQSNITNDKFVDYLKDRSEENREFLENHAPKYLLDTYNNLLSEHPGLRLVKITSEVFRDKNEGNAKFSPIRNKDATFSPTVALDFSHLENYNPDKPHIDPSTKKETFPLKHAFDTLTHALGLSTCDDPTKLNLVNTLAHEFGHADDFVENYLIPELEKYQSSLENPESSNEDPNTRPELKAIARWLATEKEAKLSSPGLLCNDKITYEENGQKITYKKPKVYPKFRKKQFNIKSKDDIEPAAYECYITNPQESYANQFALAYTLDHYQQILGEPISPAQLKKINNPYLKSENTRIITPNTLAQDLELEEGSRVALVEHNPASAKSAPLSQIMNINLNLVPFIGTVKLLSFNNQVDQLMFDTIDDMRYGGDGKIISTTNAQLTEKNGAYFVGNYEIVPVTEDKIKKINALPQRKTPKGQA